MRRICFGNQKGGVGKTTCAGNVAYALAAEHRVALIDGDPQGNTSSWLLADPPRHELADVLMERASLGDALVKLTGGLSLLPTFSLDGGLQEFADVKMVAKPFVFVQLCRDLEAHGFDFAVFDVSPGLGLLERYILLAMDEVLTPLSPEFFSLDGIEGYSLALERVNRDYERNVEHRRIVANMVNKSFRRHRSICAQFEKLDYELFTVPQDAKVAEAQLYHQPVAQYAPDSKVVPELERLAAAIASS